MPYTSIKGKKFGYNDNFLVFNDRPVGTLASIGGNTFYVDSAVDGTDGTSPEQAVGTLDEAFAKCTANQGDLIIVMPNHAETVTGASGITHDVAGVSVVGLGHGNQRPRFLMDAGTTVTYVISAADAYLENLVFAGGHSDIVTCFAVTAVGAWFNNIEFVQNTTDENFLTAIKATSTTNNNADLLKVTNCRALNIDVGTLEFLEINATTDGVVFTDNFIVNPGTSSQAVLVVAGDILTNAHIAYNYLKNAMTANELFFSSDGSTSTGIAHHNYCQHLDVTTTHDLGLESSGLALFDNYSTSSIALSGYILPAIDANA